MAEEITVKYNQVSKTANACSTCGGKGEYICPECQGSGECCTESSEHLTWDNAFAFDSIIKTRDEKTRGYGFCFFGKCSACGGKGKWLLSRCRVCNGSGKCPICHGKNICNHCEGKKKIKCKACDGPGSKASEGE